MKDFKKEYLYDFIEKGYGTKEEYNLAVTQLIKRLRASGNMEMANTIRNIQMKNSFSKKPNKSKSSYK